MQPFPPPDVILRMHQDLIRAEMARRPGHFNEPIREPARPMRTIRLRIGQALVAIGLRLDPSARQLALPRNR